MTETNALTAVLLIEIPKRYRQVRVWRQNTGSGVGMSSAQKAVALIRAHSYVAAIACLARPINFGVLGGADISGIIGPSGRRLEIEVKAGADRQSKEQRGFELMMQLHGGVYLVCHDNVDACLEELGRWV